MARKESEATRLVQTYSVQGRTNADFRDLDIKQQRQAVRTLLSDAVRKVEGTASATSTAKSKTKKGGQKVIAIGRTQGLRTLEQVAKDANFDQYIPALQFYDKHIKNNKGDKSIAKPQAGGWKDGKGQFVEIGGKQRFFLTESDYLGYLYGKLETFENADTSTNKGAMQYYREQINRSLRGLGLKEIKAKTAKTLFGYGAKDGRGEFQKLGTQTQEELREYWRFIRQQIKSGETVGYESETIIEGQAEAQRIAAKEGKTSEEANSWLIDAIVGSGKIPATVGDLNQRIRMVADFNTSTWDSDTSDQKKDLDFNLLGNIDLSEIGEIPGL